MAEKKPSERQPPQTPLLPLRDVVVYPGMALPLFVGRERSIAAVDRAMRGDHRMLLVAQKRSDVEDPSAADIYRVGTLAEVLQLVKLPDGSTKVLVEGLERCRVRSLSITSELIACSASPIRVPVVSGPDCEAAMRQVNGQFEQYVKMSPKIPQEVLLSVANQEDPGILADSIAAHLAVKVPEKQRVLATIDPIKRLLCLSAILAHEIEILQLELKIKESVRGQIDQTQREYYLNEQLKAIQRELGHDAEGDEEIVELGQQIEKAGMPEEVHARATKELDRLRAMPALAPEATIVRTYIDWLVSLPWSNETRDRLEIETASHILEEDHYGLKKPKERVLEYLAVRKLAGDEVRAPILCFVGPPGVGKTSMGQSIARALGRSFVRVSLGGVRDEAEIRGHRRTYIGALPGRIIQSMKRAGTVNPVFMLDEVDKMSVDFRGDPSAALLEVLDPEQNRAFSDHYLEVDYDLSRVMFILTANVTHPIPAALLDRMELIEIPSYTEEEKFQIARQFLVPKQKKRHGLARHRVSFTQQAVYRVIRQYTREAGVRGLEREVATICRKTARAIAEGRKGADVRRITPDRVTKLLGVPHYHRDESAQTNGVGVATGVAWTSVGGEVLTMEATLLDGTGQLTLTGMLGDVMQESAKAAQSFARSRARSLRLSKDFYKRFDIHVHIPEGAIPKDGPSAGITMATAIISALTGRPVRPYLAMTGEITLRGRVLPVGGIKEKVIAAHRGGLKTLLLPKENEKDLEEVPESVKKAIDFVFVQTMDEVLERALEN